MKTKNFCLILLALLLTTNATAQLKIGVTGGLNIGRIHVSDDTYKEYVDKAMPGFTLGPTVIFNVPKTGLGVDASALLDLRGGKSKSNSQCESVNLVSVQLPLNLRYGIDFGDMVYAFVFGGIQYGVNIGKSDQLILSGHGRTTGHAMERRWSARSGALSCNFGIGGIVMEKVQVRVSYNLPLQRTGEIQQVDLETGSTRMLTEGKAHACQVTLSYLF